MLVDRLAGVSTRRFEMTFGIALGNGEVGASNADGIVASDCSLPRFDSFVSMTGMSGTDSSFIVCSWSRPSTRLLGSGSDLPFVSFNCLLVDFTAALGGLLGLVSSIAGDIDTTCRGALASCDF